MLRVAQQPSQQVWRLVSVSVQLHDLCSLGGCVVVVVASASQPPKQAQHAPQQLPLALLLTEGQLPAPLGNRRPAG
jgi:hypothetical protein